MPYADPEKRKTYRKQYGIDNRETIREKSKDYYKTHKTERKEYYEQNKDHIKIRNKNYEARTQQWRKRREANRKAHMLRSARYRATKNNLPFDISINDFDIPESCPILGIPLFFTRNQRTDNTPSLDKIIQDKGYVKGNIQVISTKANTLKNVGTVDELILLGQWAINYKESVNNE